MSKRKQKYTDATGMAVEMLPVADLVPYVRNPKDHPPKQILELKRIISEFGFRVPVLIDEHNEIVSGHGRLLAAKELGMEAVPCLRLSGLAPEQVRAFRIADNRLAEMGNWNLDALKAEIDALAGTDFNLDLTGFSPEDLDGLLGASADGVLEQTAQDLRPYRRTHVLLSFNPDLFSRISPLLEQIVAMPGVEYEQGSNG